MVMEYKFFISKKDTVAIQCVYSALNSTIVLGLRHKTMVAEFVSLHTVAIWRLKNWK